MNLFENKNTKKNLEIGSKLDLFLIKSDTKNGFVDFGFNIDNNKRERDKKNNKDSKDNFKNKNSKLKDKNNTKERKNKDGKKNKKKRRHSGRYDSFN